jgi:hypothetical protein
MYFPGFPGCPPNWLEYSRFTVLPQDRREVPTVALERMTIGRFTLALVVAAVAVLRSAAKSPGHFPLNGGLGHLEDDVTAVAHDLRAGSAATSP